MKKATTKIKKTNRKKRIALVVSKKNTKTAIVEISRLKEDSYYQKMYKIDKRLAVEDGQDKAKKGDLVEIEECRPISKTKRWKIIEIIKK